MRFVVNIAKLTAVYVAVQVLRLRCRWVCWRVERMRGRVSKADRCQVRWSPDTLHTTFMTLPETGDGRKWDDVSV